MNIRKLPALLPFILALAAPAAAVPNQDGLVGVHKTQAATTLGEGRLQVTGYSHVINDERLLAGTSWNHMGNRETPSYFLLANDYLSLAYGLAPQWDIGLTVPFFYEEVNSSTYESKGFAWGNAKAQLKFVTPLGDSTSPFSFGILAGASTPSSEAGTGVIPRQVDWIPRKNALLKDGSRPYGVGGVEFFGALALTFDLAKTSAKLPMTWHLNGGGRKVGFEFGDDRLFDDVGYGSLAMEYDIHKYFGVNAEFYHEQRLDHFPFRQIQWERDPTTLTFGLVGNTPFGVTLQTGMVFGLLHDGENYVQAQDASGNVTHDFGLKASVPVSMVFALSWNGQIAKGDADKDGVPNKSDKCPLEAEDRDGFEDNDGCPEADNDKDGLGDLSDKCPILAEDMDGFEDVDGCPEVDNDKDGVPDVTDKCPTAAESVNGFQDEDGCPDVAIKKGEKLVLKGVFFKTGSAELLPESFVTLDTLASQLSSQLEVRLEVQGHTDNKGVPSRNKKLSADRAATVVNYLIAKGVAKDRLRPFGYGSEKPVGDNKTEDGRAQNRRVELLRID